MRVVKAETLSHKQAVKRVVNWLRNSRGCAIVMSERVTAAVSEVPDAIGWHGNGQSVLVECKISHADFLADKNKLFRKYEDRGVGDLRYFAAPKGVLMADDMPDGWGHLEISDYQIRERAKPAPKLTNKMAEVCMLVSSIRRLEIACTVFVRHEDEPRPPPPQS